jgi:hypothetical protein
MTLLSSLLPFLYRSYKRKHDLFWDTKLRLIKEAKESIIARRLANNN